MLKNEHKVRGLEKYGVGYLLGSLKMYLACFNKSKNIKAAQENALLLHNASQLQKRVSEPSLKNDTKTYIF